MSSERPVFLAAAACCLLASCGYVGDPLPPALNIASPVEDLRAIQYGDRLVVDFSIPPLTTEGLAIKHPGKVELRAGAAPDPFNADVWGQSATALPLEAAEVGPIHAEFPIAQFIGRQLAIGVRLINSKGRASGWSNFVTLTAVPPAPAPGEVRAESHPDGARVSWSGEGSFRVYRRGPADKTQVQIGTADKPEYIDKTAQYGVRYEYLVQAVRGQAESEVSRPTEVTPSDIFAPAVPSGLNAVAGIGSIELVWDRNTEPDLKGYRVYRGVDGGEFDVVAPLAEAPAFSDRQVESGKRYRYAIRAIDQTGNESTMTASVEIAAP